jgi:protocatechuate 3,4-dioxygenase beta subunit
MRAALSITVALVTAGCTRPPPPTAATRVLERNPRAVVEGRVVDTQGRPVAGLRVEAVPRGKDVAWSQPATTDSEGRFTLTLLAPAEYGFVLSEGNRTVVTDDPRDPAHVKVVVRPGERRDGVELLFLREKWKGILRSRRHAPADGPRQVTI